MLHKMTISESAFVAIKSGEKTVEVRLYDGKRQLIKIGDQIEFSTKTKKLKVVVLNLEKFTSFLQLLEQHSEKLGLSRFESPNDWLREVRKIYPLERKRKYGVLAIQLEVIN